MMRWWWGKVKVILPAPSSDAAWWLYVLQGGENRCYTTLLKHPVFQSVTVQNVAAWCTCLVLGQSRYFLLLPKSNSQTRIHKRLSIHSQLNPVRTVTICFFTIPLNVLSPSTLGSLKASLLYKPADPIASPFCYMPIIFSSLLLP